MVNRSNKAMTMSLNVVITIVVLLVVAMILILLVSNNVIKFSSNSQNSIDSAGSGVQCQTEIATYCISHESGDTCTECESCPDQTCP